jgi:hypothetical protein
MPRYLSIIESQSCVPVPILKVNLVYTVPVSSNMVNLSLLPDPKIFASWDWKVRYYLVQPGIGYFQNLLIIHPASKSVFVSSGNECFWSGASLLLESARTVPVHFVSSCNILRLKVISESCGNWSVCVEFSQWTLSTSSKFLWANYRMDPLVSGIFYICVLKNNISWKWLTG